MCAAEQASAGTAMPCWASPALPQPMRGKRSLRMTVACWRDAANSALPAELGTHLPALDMLDNVGADLVLQPVPLLEVDVGSQPGCPAAG
jgi:hypothetical protein